VQQGPVDQVAVVRDQRDVPVDLGVVPGPDDGDLGTAQRQPVARCRGAGVDPVELLRGLPVGDQGGVRVGAEQGPQLVGVDVVEVLMGDQDRVQPVEGLESGRERARVEQQPGGAGVDQDAGVAVVRDLHVPQHPRPVR
jgi:hypothetical protein